MLSALFCSTRWIYDLKTLTICILFWIVFVLDSVLLWVIDWDLLCYWLMDFDCDLCLLWIGNLMCFFLIDTYYYFFYIFFSFLVRLTPREAPGNRLETRLLLLNLHEMQCDLLVKLLLIVSSDMQCELLVKVLLRVAYDMQWDTMWLLVKFLLRVASNLLVKFYDWAHFHFIKYLNLVFLSSLEFL